MLQPQEEDCTNLAEALEHAVVLKMPPQLMHDPQRAATNQVAPALEDSGGVWQMVSGLMHFQLQTSCCNDDELRTLAWHAGGFSQSARCCDDER